jgi:hypothetical protein
MAGEQVMATTADDLDQMLRNAHGYWPPAREAILRLIAEKEELLREYHDRAVTAESTAREALARAAALARDLGWGMKDEFRVLDEQGVVWAWADTLPDARHYLMQTPGGHIEIWSWNEKQQIWRWEPLPETGDGERPPLPSPTTAGP